MTAGFDGTKKDLDALLNSLVNKLGSDVNQSTSEIDQIFYAVFRLIVVSEVRLRAMVKD